MRKQHKSGADGRSNKAAEDDGNAREEARREEVGGRDGILRFELAQQHQIHAASARITSRSNKRAQKYIQGAMCHTENMARLGGWAIGNSDGAFRARYPKAVK
jgi:hypothetical protein